MYIIIYDFGTSSVKSCLFEIDTEIHLVTASAAGYGLYISDDGGAEQDTEEWWAALCTTTRDVLDKSDIRAEEIEGMAFCSQMQGSVFVDRDGKAVRRPMNYLTAPRIAYQLLAPNFGKKNANWGYGWIPAVAPICGGIVASLLYNGLRGFMG